MLKVELDKNQSGEPRPLVKRGRAQFSVISLVIGGIEMAEVVQISRKDWLEKDRIARFSSITEVLDAIEGGLEL